MTDIKKRALELYTPPFEFMEGYIFDGRGKMVADNHHGREPEEVTNTGDMALRVRGWGRISYLENPEELQDTVGEMMADALTAYWKKNTERP